MSTAFYATFNKCHCCGRADRIHIGSAIGGSRFLFRGYREWEEKCLNGIDVDGYKKWVDLLTNMKDLEIASEDDEPYTLDEFLALVESKQKLKTNTDGGRILAVGEYEFCFDWFR
jgi:hypothetical protein